MSKVFIIRGPLGIGKTTISKHVAERINGVYISVDDVLDEHGLSKVDKELGCISLASFLQVNEMVLPGIREFLAEGQDVVLDGNFYHQEQIEDIVQGVSNFPITVVTLTAPLSVCIERDAQRLHSYGEDAATAVFNLVDQVKYGEEVDTVGKSISQVVTRILEITV